MVEGYTASLMRMGRSLATVKTYLGACQDFRRHLAGAHIDTGRAITREHLEAWQDSLVPRVSGATRNVYANGVRSLLRWAASRDLVAPQLVDAVVPVKYRRKLRRPLPEQDLARLLDYFGPRRPHMSVIGLRDRALFYYLLTTGARVSEALQVTVAEMARAIVWQKGGSEKVLTVPPACMGVLDDYLQARQDSCPWLWVTFDSNRPLRRLQPEGVREIWKKVARNVGVAPFVTHQLRHTCATELLAARVDVVTIAAHLGHKGLRTLQEYAMPRDPLRQEAIDVMQRLMAPARPRWGI